MQTGRQKLVKAILEFLNEKKIRCTYGAVAGLLNVIPQSVKRFLGEPRPEASWVVRHASGEPTGYLKMQMHLNLRRNQRIISDPQELRKEVGEFQNSKHGEADGGTIFDAIMDEIDNTENSVAELTMGDWVRWWP